MSERFKLIRIPSLKTVDAFRGHIDSLDIEIPCDVEIIKNASPISQPLNEVKINGKRIGNRVAIHPMEGWDGTTGGGVTDPMRRRWRRFGQSGAKLICGGEAMAVRPDGRANPNQLIINKENQRGISELRDILLNAHQEKFGNTEDLAIGFQLTHSGRFCRPNEKFTYEPKVAYKHPILDEKFKVQGEQDVLTDAELDELVIEYVQATRIAREVGADFVDIKHCHGYLLHELLGAHTRDGRYGGSFENRTRMLREIVAAIRADGNDIDLAVRLSTFDMVPHRPDPKRSHSDKLGPGIPEEHELPFPYQFGVDHEDPTKIDLRETFGFVNLCSKLGIKLINTTAGSPYYTPHLQRPAAYPPSDGYQPAYDPLIDVARQIKVVRELKKQLPGGMAIIASGLSYLQEYLPHVCQALLREGWADMVGLGRVILSYPDILNEATECGELKKRLVCRTFSDCTTAPRKGLPSGCFPLDDFYSQSETAAELKAQKKTG
ncbi:MAG: NADH:flavin oxidoreductase [SAR202 cluster bacterium]|nr:NADH:flavin oxidoreductase [SAR202 cluster bacterium]|tara:strand:+ start:673 stop:2145 length:1473 start_codon:yes stop_codon:yes gene_type:complete